MSMPNMNEEKLVREIAESLITTEVEALGFVARHEESTDLDHKLAGVNLVFEGLATRRSIGSSMLCYDITPRGWAVLGVLQHVGKQAPR